MSLFSKRSFLCVLFAISYWCHKCLAKRKGISTLYDGILTDEGLGDYTEFETNPSTSKYISLNVEPAFSREVYSAEDNANFDWFQYFEKFLKDESDPRYGESYINHVNKRIHVEKVPEKQHIPRHKMRTYPYSNVVKISSGCTGTLLTPTHVLTAAHCVHDGEDFKENMEMLKVEVTNRLGYRIHYIVKINVPVMWLKTQSLPEVGRGAFDYAVLQLNIPVSGRDKFMQLALPTAKTMSSDLKFLGFKSNVLWSSTCSADENILLMRGNIVLRRCESSAGNSGAAAFSANAIDGNKIVGLLSNTVSSSTDDYEADESSYEVIMLLTLQKCLDICAMIHPEGDKYDVCETVKRNNVQYLEVGSTRIKPFFG